MLTAYVASKEPVRRGIAKLKVEIMKNRHAPVAWQVGRINQSLRGMFNYFCFSDCAVDQYRIQYEIMRTWYRALGSRSQRHLSWKNFYKILAWNPLQKTKVRIKFGAFEQFFRCKPKCEEACAGNPPAGFCGEGLKGLLPDVKSTVFRSSHIGKIGQPFNGFKVYLKAVSIVKSGSTHSMVEFNQYPKKSGSSPRTESVEVQNGVVDF